MAITNYYSHTDEYGDQIDVSVDQVRACFTVSTADSSVCIPTSELHMLITVLQMHIKDADDS